MNRNGQVTKRRQAVGKEQARDLPSVRVIPFDYVAQFELTGRVGNLLQDVINISVEGMFVAVSISYGLDEERAAPLRLLRTDSSDHPSGVATLGDVTLDQIPPDVLIEGFRLNPDFAPIALQSGQLKPELPLDLAGDLFQRLAQTENFSFLLSIEDTASGRELQNEPVHSVATLGRADGSRPFKMLPQPMVFMPRSTLRLQVEERSADVSGRLFIALQGYKVLGVAGAAEEEVRRLSTFDPRKQIPSYDHESGNFRRAGERRQSDVLTPKLVPFDYVSTLDLTGKPGNLVEDEIPINIDGGYVATSVGYGLDVDDTRIQINVDPSQPMVHLGQIKLTDIEPVQALFDGIRIHPLRVRFAFFRGGQLAAVPQDMAGRMFQNLNLPTAARFLYSISDTGTGRDLQNQPLLNLAGLGRADGDRPFKVLHKPMRFLPRSTIRVQVEEHLGRGRLFIVFQGYKIL